MKIINSLILVLVFLIQSCTDQEIPAEQPIVVVKESQNDPQSELQFKQSKMIDRPIDQIDIDFQVFDYSDRQGANISLSSGTTITVPSDAFQTINGEDVSGKVDIHYREFHNISDIMLSGITMVYEDGDFESAGMFEIRAFSNGDELALKPNKSIDVDLASYKSGNFNQYNLDEKTKKWNFIEKSKPRKNQRKLDKLSKNDSIMKAFKPVCKIRPQVFNDGDEVFDLSYHLSERSDMDVFSGAMWRIEGDEQVKERFRHDQRGYNDFEIMPYDSCNTYRIALWEKRDIERVPDTSYYLATPVWKGKQYDNVLDSYSEKIKQFNHRVAEVAKERKCINREADLIRSFKIKGMGIYNCDRVLDFLKMVPLALTIKFKDKIKTWWYITQNKSIAVKYYQSDIENFKYNPNAVNGIIAILPDNKIGVVSNEEFIAAYKNYQSGENQKLILELEEQPDPVLKKETFAQNISSL